MNESADSPACGLINVSLLAHSTGAFVATQAVRTLSDVFAPMAIERWKWIDPQYGPSALSGRGADAPDPAWSQIGELFQWSR